MRILLVDDEETVLEIITKWLEQAGHSVSTAHNNKEALAIYGPAAYDVVLTDAEHLEPVWQNPDGREGLKLAEIIRQKNPQQRVGFIIASVDDIPGYPTLHKPFEHDELLQFVMQV